MRIDGRAVRFIKVGEGAYNTTYVTREPFAYTINDKEYTQHWLLKQPKRAGRESLTKEMNAPSRMIRLWNVLNPERPAAYIPEHDGALIPFLGTLDKDLRPITCGVSDRACADKQIEIYKQHRRIIADACGHGNFLFHDGEVYCVDVDQAVGMDSPISTRIHKELIDDPEMDMEGYWQHYLKRGYPKTVKAICSLLYLEKYFPPEEMSPQFLARYINLRVLDKVYHYRQSNKPLSIELLKSFNRRDHKNTLLKPPPIPAVEAPTPPENESYLAEIIKGCSIM